MANIELLKPKVKELVQKLVNECQKAGIQIVITQTLRTIVEQDELYAQGRTKPGNIVTNAKGGYSLHNYGVAFDICPTVGGKLIWTDNNLFKKIGAIGIGLGLEWGGTWTTFIDLPHFQYLAGYTLTNFRENKVDWSKFETNITTPSIVTPTSVSGTLKVTAQDGLNVRSGPDATFAKLGKLAFEEKVIPLGKKDGWVPIDYKGSVGWVSATYLI